MMIRTVLSLVLAAPVACFALPWAALLFWDTLSDVGAWPPHPWPVVIGAAIGFALVWWKKPNWLVHTMIHETCHAIACWLLLVRIRNFQASDGEGGQVLHDKTDPFRTIIICLAPYTLPLLLAPFLVWHYFASHDTRVVLDGIIAFLYLHHLHGLYHNVRLNFWGRQADLTKAGKILSVVTIATVLILISHLVLLALWHKW